MSWIQIQMKLRCKVTQYVHKHWLLFYHTFMSIQYDVDRASTSSSSLLSFFTECSSDDLNTRLHINLQAPQQSQRHWKDLSLWMFMLQSLLWQLQHPHPHPLFIFLHNMSLESQWPEQRNKYLHIQLKMLLLLSRMFLSTWIWSDWAYSSTRWPEADLYWLHHLKTMPITGPTTQTSKSVSGGPVAEVDNRKFRWWNRQGNVTTIFPLCKLDHINMLR